MSNKREWGGAIGAAAGAVYGYYTGNYAAVYYGFSIGYGIGAAVETKPGMQGPRLEDLKFTSSQYGQPIPCLFGAPRVSGQIIWASDKREIATSAEAGKGGGPTNTSYTYEIDVLVMLCDHQADAVTRIWSNGKLVWNRLTGASAGTLAASDGSDLWTELIFYSGAATQLPDPTYEAAVGVGNAPAYRGRATLMIEGLQLGSSGQLPNLTFEVMRSSAYAVGTTTSGVSQAASVPFAVGLAASTSTTFQVAIGQWPALTVVVYDLDIVAGTSTQVGGYSVLNWTEFPCGVGNSDVPVLHASSGTTGRSYTGTSGTQTVYTYPENLGGQAVRIARLGSTVVIGSSANGSRKVHRFATTGGSALVSSLDLGDYVDSLLIFGGSVYAAMKNTKTVVVLDLSTLTVQNTLNRPGFGFGPADITPRLFLLGNEVGLISYQPVGNLLYGVHALRGGAWALLGSLPTGPIDNSNDGQTMGVVGGLLVMGRCPSTTYQTWSTPLTNTGANPTLRSVVETICARAGMPADTYDASALATITQPVRSLAIPVGPSRPTLEQLSTAFFFEAFLRDKIYFRPRGGAAVATIPWSDLAARADDPDDQSLPLSIGNHLELPPQAAVTYINVNDDSQSGTEYSDRFTSGQAAVQSVNLGLGLMPAEAKGVADAIVADTQAALVQGTVALPMIYAYLDPSEVVNVVDRDARTYRLRLGRKTDEAGVLSFDVVADDALAISSIRTTDPGPGNVGTVTKNGDTLFLPLDIPLLRDDDNSAGWYVAAKGSTTQWPGGLIKVSADNVTFTSAAEVNESGVFGVCTTTLGNFTGTGFDEVNSVTVNVGNGTLASSTRDAMLGDPGINAMMIGDEAIRFRSAALGSPGIYTLTGLLRGQKGTDWAMATHAAAERAVLLRAAGMRRVAQNLNENGQLRYLRAGTLGASVLPATTQFTNQNRALKPLAPVSVRGTALDGQRLALSWLRRSRLSTKLLNPAGVPLDEAVESYVVRIYSLGPTTLKRTIQVQGASTVVYERAQQIADGITAGVAARVDVAQISAAVGEGYIGSGEITGLGAVVAQISKLTIGGTWQNSITLRAKLAGVNYDYTTVAGSPTNGQAATALAAVIDAAAAYTATAVASDITVTGAPGVVFSVVPSIVGSDGTFTVLRTQEASGPAPGLPLVAEIRVFSAYNAALDPIEGDKNFRLGVEQPLGNTIADYTLTSNSGGEALAGFYQRFASAWNLLPAFVNAGYQMSYANNGVDPPRVYLTGPTSVLGIALVAPYTTPPWGLTSTVVQPARLPIVANQPQIVEVTLGGTPVTGAIWRIRLNLVDFDYTVGGGDTLSTIATALAASIDASADYVSTAVGAVVTITSLPLISFDCTGSVIVSTMTLTHTLIQQAGP